MADCFFMAEKLTTILSIGGSDCMGGAGIQTDLRVSAEMGLHCMTVITAVTAQNSKGIHALNDVPAHMVQSQLDSILSEIRPNTVKIGMIGNLENGRVISDILRQLPKKTSVIIDPLLAASKGGNLIKDNNSIDFKKEIVRFFIDNLFPYATVVTPSTSEANFFAEENNILYGNDKDYAAKLLEVLGCKGLVLKGGDSDGNIVKDLLAIKTDVGILFDEFTSKRIDCNNLHGTGCAFGAYLATYMAKGFSLQESFQLASFMMKKIISDSCDYSLGASLYGPLNITGYELKSIF